MAKATERSRINHKWMHTPKGERCSRCDVLVLSKYRPSKRKGARPGEKANYAVYVLKGQKLSEGVEMKKAPPCTGGEV